MSLVNTSRIANAICLYLQSTINFLCHYRKIHHLAFQPFYDSSGYNEEGVSTLDCILFALLLFLKFLKLSAVFTPASILDLSTGGIGYHSHKVNNGYRKN